MGWQLGVLWKPVMGEIISFWAHQWELLKEMDLGGWVPLKIGPAVPWGGGFQAKGSRQRLGGMQTAAEHSLCIRHVSMRFPCPISFYVGNSITPPPFGKDFIYFF